MPSLFRFKKGWEIKEEKTGDVIAFFPFKDVEEEYKNFRDVEFHLGSASSSTEDIGSDLTFVNSTGRVKIKIEDEDGSASTMVIKNIAVFGENVKKVFLTDESGEDNILRIVKLFKK